MEDKEKLGIEVVVDEPELPLRAPKPAKAVVDALAEDAGVLPEVPKPAMEAVAVLDAPKPVN